MKKYELTSETKTVRGSQLFRIKALISFENVKKGDLGGWIEKEENLSQDGNAWIYDEAQVRDNAIVCDDAIVRGNAIVRDNAMVYGKAIVCNDAGVRDNVVVCDNARVYDNAWVYNNAMVCDDAKVFGNAMVCDATKVFGNARVYDKAIVSGNARVFGHAVVRDNAKVSDEAMVYDNARVYGNAKVCDNAAIKTKTDILIVSPIGSRDDVTTFFKNEEKSISVKCGCFTGSIDKFEEAVNDTHKGTIYEKQYKLAIELAKTKILNIEQEVNMKKKQEKIRILQQIKQNKIILYNGKAKTVKRIWFDYKGDCLISCIRVANGLNRTFPTWFFKYLSEPYPSWQDIEDYAIKIQFEENPSRVYTIAKDTSLSLLPNKE